jgi:hypothetical protein
MCSGRVNRFCFLNVQIRFLNVKIGEETVKRWQSQIRFSDGLAL